MDQGTNAEEMLNNHEENLHLLHGYVAVRNRTNQEILNQISVEEAHEKER